ncbi:AaceriADR228Wp [[Ashbya] aceris (nom. inval.)]|nr:AaceriADR228Wp [[Ashbya] aceris (nom. inval.)]
MSQSVRHAAVASVKKHFKFDTAEAAALADETVVTEEMADLAPGAEEASDSSSDDEAPEEEGLEVVRAAAKSSESVRAAAVKHAREQERARRAQQHQRYAEQQEHKRQQEEELRVSEPKAAGDTESEVEELPEDFFEELEELPKPIATRPTKINFNEVGEQYAEPLRAELKKQKKKTLKSLRKRTMKRGPVLVSVLSPVGARSAQPPKKETAVLNVKDKWLRRSALKRK